MNRLQLTIFAALLQPTFLFAQAGSCDVPASTSINDLLPLIAQCVDPLPKGVDEPLFADLGTHTCPVAFQGTDAGKAQKYFDQGLTLYYGFNMPESLLSFAQAAQIDKDAPMPYWGIAFAAGPNINHAQPHCNCLKLCFVAARTAVHKAEARALKAGVAKNDFRRFTAALRTDNVGAARAVVEKYPGAVRQTLRELAWAAALAQRYACTPNACPKCGLDATYRSNEAQDVAFSRAMQGCHELFPTDADVAVVYAAALMQIHPWQWWGRDKAPTAETATAIKVLQEVLATNVDHPGANHFYIHAVEEGPLSWIENALPCAHRLARLVPGAGHLVHMPSHIYRNVGLYDLATEINERAVDVDRRDVKEIVKYHPVSSYPRHYFAHNLHFLITTRIAQGQRGPAFAAARELIDLTPEYVSGNNIKLDEDMIRGSAEWYLTVPLTVSWQFDFDQWQETRDRVLKARKKIAAVLKQAGVNNADLPYNRAMLAYGDTLYALTRKDWKAALGHVKEYKEITRRSDGMLQNNSVASFYKIADNVLIARAAQAEQADEAGKSMLVALLGILDAPFNKEMPADELALKAWQAAVAHQDQQNYSDPPDWYYPVRQSLGAAYYLRARFADAETTFRQDLKNNPGNPLSLFGLIECLRKQDKSVPAYLERQLKRLRGSNPLPSLKTM